MAALSTGSLFRSMATVSARAISTVMRGAGESDVTRETRVTDEVVEKCSLTTREAVTSCPLTARASGYHITEVPVNWTDQPGSKVDVVTDGPRILAEAIRARWRIGTRR